MTGIFISFEGPEACGKSTQLELLAQRLKGSGYDVTRVREPGGTRIGEIIRDILQHDLAGENIYNETEALLFAASRAQLVREVIIPALQAGKVVLADRFIDSSIVYQGYARGLDVEEITRINQFAVDGAMPGVSFLIDIDIGLAFSRLRERHLKTGVGFDRMERQSSAFHEKVKQGFICVAKRWSDRFVVIDGKSSEKDVHEQIFSEVEQRFLRTGVADDI